MIRFGRLRHDSRVARATCRRDSATSFPNREEGRTGCAFAATKTRDGSYPLNQRMGGTMMNVRNNVAVGAGAAVLATIGTLAVGSLPLLAGLTIATLLFAGFAYVAFTAQSRRFHDESRFVYRPVYVRSRNVHRQVRSLDD